MHMFCLNKMLVLFLMVLDLAIHSLGLYVLFLLAMCYHPFMCRGM